jgi:hypothetical protein
MTRLAAFLAILIALLVHFAMPADAQQQCPPRAQLVESLAKKFGETQRTMGYVGGANNAPVTAVMETYANDTTGTWTILLAKPDGTACMMASGGGWIGDAMPPGERA